MYKKKFEFTYEELKYFLKNIQEEITNRAKPRNNAIETINRLRKEGHKIIIITARDSEFHDNPYLLSKNWLDKNNIEYDKLIVNAREKGTICKNENIDLFIDDTIYSKRKLTEYLFRDIGILFGGIFIGKSFSGILVNYNTCLIISNIFLVISIMTMMNIKINQIEEKQKKKDSMFKYILKSKILSLYLLDMFVGTIAMSTALGLKMLTLTNYFAFSDNVATNYLLVVGLLADGIGILALKYLTPKNDYLTITIKFGIRFMGYVIAFISNNIMITLIAITWSLLISTAYENICDGVYINRLEKDHQLSFANINKAHPHKFRRTMATMTIDKGMLVEQVQKLLGHIKIDTTMEYAMVSQNNVKNSHRKYIT